MNRLFIAIFGGILVFATGLFLDNIEPLEIDKGHHTGRLGNVKIIEVPDGPRCVRFSNYQGSGISCDWASHSKNI